MFNTSASVCFVPCFLENDVRVELFAGDQKLRGQLVQAAGAGGGRVLQHTLPRRSGPQCLRTTLKVPGAFSCRTAEHGGGTEYPCTTPAVSAVGANHDTFTIYYTVTLTGIKAVLIIIMYSPNTIGCMYYPMLF